MAFLFQHGGGLVAFLEMGVSTGASTGAFTREFVSVAAFDAEHQYFMGTLKLPENIYISTG